jgi:chorismate dehydratase
MQKIRVGAVSYLNTKPLVYGFELGMMNDEIELSFDYPANVAKKLLNDEIDVGLIPVAVLPELLHYEIISDYCISANGPVASVCVFSDVPLSEIKEIVVDYQSRTSAALLKILIAQHWKIDVVLTAADKGYETKIFGTTAGLVIGDRAFVQREKSKYIFDLAEAWKQMTGLPFVFAVWAANKSVSQNFKSAFNQVCTASLTNIQQIIINQNYKLYNLQVYYTNNISYQFSEEKKAGLNKFLTFLNTTAI